MASVVRGTGVRGINIFDLRRLRVPMPELSQQQSLASVFDTWARHDESLKATIDKTRTKLATYRDALITEAITGQLDVSTVSDAQMNEFAHAAAEGAVAGDRTPAQVV